MSSNLVTTKQLFGKRVVGGKKRKRIGKVRRFVFHPSERRCIGFLVKRPDAAMMFHRKDLFVSLGGFDIEDGDIVVRDDPDASERGAVKALGVNWSECVIWVGMPAYTSRGDFLGYIDSVCFDRATGEVESLTTENGLASDAIVGKRVIPGDMVRGFKRNAPASGERKASEDEVGGAILVADEAMQLGASGGVAAAAGKASAVVSNKAKKHVTRVKPKAHSAAKRAGKAVEDGAYVAGKQLGRATGMFAAFKEEYDKAVHEDDR